MRFQRAKEAVRNILGYNARFMANNGREKFEPLLTGQTPRVTVVSCSDSRVDMRALHDNPVNDLFVIRNIGNQIVTTEGSLDYAIRHLHTPVLLIMGHVRCGAIRAAQEDYSGETPAIQRELNALALPKGGDWLEGVTWNVNRQVETALAKYSGEVEAGDLAVVGGIYDFADDLGEGYGKFAITNIQGEAEPHALRAFITQHLKP